MKRSSQRPSGLTAQGACVTALLTFATWAGAQLTPSLLIKAYQAPDGPPRYAVIDLGPNFNPVGVNDSGVVVGNTPTGPAMWTGTTGSLTPLHTDNAFYGHQLSGYTAVGIDNLGHMVGNANYTGSDTRYFPQIGCYWDNKDAQPLQLGPAESDPNDPDANLNFAPPNQWPTGVSGISPDGYIVGRWNGVAAQYSPHWMRGNTNYAHIMYVDTPFENGYDGTTAPATGGTNQWCCFSSAGGFGQLVTWFPAVNGIGYKDIQYANLNPVAMNNHQFIAGTEGFLAGVPQAFVAIVTGTDTLDVTHLGPGVVTAINDQTTTTGTTTTSNPQIIGTDGGNSSTNPYAPLYARPVLWDKTAKSGAVTNVYVGKYLNDLLPQTTGTANTHPWSLQTTTAINYYGAIVGAATYTGTATTAGSHGVLLAPFVISQTNYPVPSTANKTTDSGSATVTQVIAGAGAADGIALITGAPAMPQLTAKINGFDGSGLTVDWRLAVTSERSERGTKDNLFIPVAPGEGGTGGPGVVDNEPIGTAWDISNDYLANPQSFFGGNVTIYYRIKKPDGTYLEPAEETIQFKIRGLNPLDATAKSFIISSVAGGVNPDVFQFAWAIVQHESRETYGSTDRVYNQFNAGGTTGELPNFGAPDGWGIAQLDHPLGVTASTDEVYNWKLNVNKFYQEIDQKIGVQQRFFAAIAAAYPTDTDAQNPPTTTLYGQSMTALAAGAITLYNGAGAPLGGTPCPTTTLGGVSYQNPWTFNHSPTSGPKWVYHPNGYDYLHQVVLEYLGTAEIFNE